jgi:hypothetical protein
LVELSTDPRHLLPQINFQCMTSLSSLERSIKVWEQGVRCIMHGESGTSFECHWILPQCNQLQITDSQYCMFQDIQRGECMPHCSLHRQCSMKTAIDLKHCVESFHCALNLETLLARPGPGHLPFLTSVMQSWLHDILVRSEIRASVILSRALNLLAKLKLLDSFLGS